MNPPFQSDAWALPPLASKQPYPDLFWFTPPPAYHFHQDELDTNYLPLFWLMDMSRSPCHCFSRGSAEDPFEHPLHLLARAAYNFKAKCERSSKSLARSHFPPDLTDHIALCLQVYADGTSDYHLLRSRQAHNAAFWTGVRAGSPELLRAALRDLTWEVNGWYFSRLAETLLECADKVRGEVLALLLADRRRFGAGMLERIVAACFDGPVASKRYWEPEERIKDWKEVEDSNARELDVGAWREQQVMTLVVALLEDPQVNPGVIWDKVLAGDVDLIAAHPGALGNTMSAMGAMLVTGEWQLARSKTARSRRHAPTPRHSTADRLQQPLLPSRCAKPDSRVILDLPYDVQRHLLDYLDFASVSSLRLTCRHLRDEFPLGQHATRFLERELHMSSRPGYSYSSVRFQSLLDAVPRNQGPSTLDYRMLVEAIRHLDVDLALRFLEPTSDAYDLRKDDEPGLVRYVYPWSLHVLLFEANVTSNLSGTRHLLLALLFHQDMPTSAWILLALAYNQSTRYLLPLQCPSGLDEARQLFLNVLSNGSLPPTIPDSIRQGLADPTSITTRLLISFVLVHFTPAAFKQLTSVLPTSPDSDADLRVVFVLAFAHLVPVAKLIECKDLALMSQVFHWMMLELEAQPGSLGKSRKSVFTMAFQVCKAMQNTARQATHQGKEEGPLDNVTFIAHAKRFEAVERAEECKRVSTIRRGKTKSKGKLPACLVQ